VNLYVIDDVTRLPIGNASVQVGTVTGVTDATGLFVASGVTGPQTIAVKAASYKSVLWVGANGANVTIDLTLTTDPPVTSADLAGAILGFNAITPPAGHHKTALVTYSQSDLVSDAENNLKTSNNRNICDTGVATDGCTFTVTARAGTVGLVAMILDHDLNGTPTNPNDDTFTVIGWATRTGVAVTNGVNQSGQDLTMVGVGNLADETVDFGSPPSALPNVGGLIGIDLGASGTLQLPSLLSPTSRTLLAPRLADFPGATYRFTAIANNGTTSTAAQSYVLSRGQTAATLTAATWLPPPTGTALTRTDGSWNAVPGALVQGADFDQDATHHLLSVTVFDGSTSFTIADLVALPTSGALLAKGTAIRGTFDVTSFAIDTDRDKITAAANQPMQIN
jgi:hypothetical protein